MAALCERARHALRTARAQRDEVAVGDDVAPIAKRDDTSRRARRAADDGGEGDGLAE